MNMNGKETMQFSSSNLAEATYDPDTENLEITFQSGDTYTYFNVSAATYRSLQHAGSPGQFFHRHIKGRHSYDGPS